jgi:hypothetical protein
VPPHRPQLFTLDPLVPPHHHCQLHPLPQVLEIHGPVLCGVRIWLGRNRNATDIQQGCTSCSASRMGTRRGGGPQTPSSLQFLGSISFLFPFPHLGICLCYLAFRFFSFCSLHFSPTPFSMIQEWCQKQKHLIASSLCSYKISHLYICHTQSWLNVLVQLMFLFSFLVVIMND